MNLLKGASLLALAKSIYYCCIVIVKRQHYFPCYVIAAFTWQLASGIPYWPHVRAIPSGSSTLASNSWTSKLKLFPSQPCPVAMLFAFVVALTFTGPKFQQICNILNNFMFWEIVILIELISLINWLWVFTHSPLRSILACYLVIYPAQQTELRQSSYIGL